MEQNEEIKEIAKTFSSIVSSELKQFSEQLLIQMNKLAEK